MNHAPNVTIVSGMLVAQKIQNCFETRELPEFSELQWNSGVEKSAATNVLGRNMTVTAARVFIAFESSRVADASVLES